MTPERAKWLRLNDPVWRAKVNRQKKLWRRSRIKSDPTYAAKENASVQAWKDRKIARCPEYAQIQPLRSRLGQLREKVEYHRKIADDAEKTLLYIARKYAKLCAYCKGK